MMTDAPDAVRYVLLGVRLRQVSMLWDARAKTMHGGSSQPLGIL